jgi:hypothetical protein
MPVIDDDVDSNAVLTALNSFDQRIQSITNTFEQCCQQVRDAEHQLHNLQQLAVAQANLNPELDVELAEPKKTRFRKILDRFNHIMGKIQKLKDVIMKLKGLTLTTVKTAYLISVPVTATVAVAAPAVFRVALTVAEHVKKNVTTVLNSEGSYQDKLAGLAEVASNTVVHLDEQIQVAETESQLTCITSESGSVSCSEAGIQHSEDDGLNSRHQSSNEFKEMQSRISQNNAARAAKAAKLAANKNVASKTSAKSLQVVAKQSTSKVAARATQIAANKNTNSKTATNNTSSTKTTDKPAAVLSQSNNKTQTSTKSPDNSISKVDKAVEIVKEDKVNKVNSAFKAAESVSKNLPEVVTSDPEASVATTLIVEKTPLTTENAQTVQSPNQTLIALTRYMPAKNAARVASELTRHNPKLAREIAKQISSNNPAATVEVQAAVDLAVTNAGGIPVSPAN